MIIDILSFPLLLNKHFVLIKYEILCQDNSHVVYFMLFEIDDKT